MKIFLMILEICVSLLLIGAVFLHPPKTEGMGSIGGAAQIFRHARGLDGLTRLTLGLGALFFILSIVLGFFI